MKNFLFDTLQDKRFKVEEPILIKFARAGRRVVAEARELDEFGCGTTRSEALRDLQFNIIDLYFILEQDRHRLGPSLHKTWVALQRKILRVAR